MRHPELRALIVIDYLIGVKFGAGAGAGKKRLGWTPLGSAMNDWKSSAGGGNRNYRGPNGTAEKVDYSQLPIGGGGSDDDAEGDDWIQRQIRGHKVRVVHVAVVIWCYRREACARTDVR